MIGAALEGRTILIVEDEYFQARDAELWLRQAGAKVIGPIATVGGLAALPKHLRIDAAIVDVNLGSGVDFRASRELRRRGIPMIFVTGYDCTIVPPDLGDIPCLNKPVDARQVVLAINHLLATAPGSQKASMSRVTCAAEQSPRPTLI